MGKYMLYALAWLGVAAFGLVVESDSVMIMGPLIIATLHLRWADLEINHE